MLTVYNYDIDFELYSYLIHLEVLLTTIFFQKFQFEHLQVMVSYVDGPKTLNLRT